MVIIIPIEVISFFILLKIEYNMQKHILLLCQIASSKSMIFFVVIFSCEWNVSFIIEFMFYLKFLLSKCQSIAIHSLFFSTADPVKAILYKLQPIDFSVNFHWILSSFTGFPRILFLLVFYRGFSGSFIEEKFVGSSFRSVSPVSLVFHWGFGF